MSNRAEADQLSPRRKVLIVPIALLGSVMATLLVSGCGQRGPLYLPDDEVDAARRRRRSDATLPPTTPEVPSR